MYSVIYFPIPASEKHSIFNIWDHINMKPEALCGGTSNMLM